jgi:hypothetical protein
MNTVGNTNSSVPPTVNPPANPAKGNKRGQTTLAAEIDRWQAMANNLAPQIEQLPGLKEPFAQFQALLDQAITVRNQLKMEQAQAAMTFTRRDQLMADGAVLFSRLRLGLQSVHGPESPKLREFGLKPHKRGGRPRNSTTTPPQVEVATHPAAVPPAGVSPKE